MKAFTWIVILALIGFAVYYFMFSNVSEQEKQVKELEKKFDEATKMLISAESTAGRSGLDTTADAATAIRRAREVRRDLRELMPTLTEEKAIRKAEELEDWIEEFFKKHGLI